MAELITKTIAADNRIGSQSDIRRSSDLLVGRVLVAGRVMAGALEGEKLVNAATAVGLIVRRRTSPPRADRSPGN